MRETRERGEVSFHDFIEFGERRVMVMERSRRKVFD